MAELAFTIPLAAAVTGLQTRGWKLASWSVTATLAALGIVSVMFPNSPSSFGSLYGLFATAVALILLILTYYRTKYKPDPSDLT